MFFTATRDLKMAKHVAQKKNLYHPLLRIHILPLYTVQKKYLFFLIFCFHLCFYSFTWITVNLKVSAIFLFMGIKQMGSDHIFIIRQFYLNHEY